VPRRELQRRRDQLDPRHSQQVGGEPARHGDRVGDHELRARRREEVSDERGDLLATAPQPKPEVVVPGVCVELRERREGRAASAYGVRPPVTTADGHLVTGSVQRHRESDGGKSVAWIRAGDDGDASRSGHRRAAAIR